MEIKKKKPVSLLESAEPAVISSEVQLVSCKQGSPGPVGPPGSAGPSGEKVDYTFFVCLV